MPMFASRRERRLWLWTVALVLAIVSTLGLARSLAGVLRDRGQIDSAFVFGLVLVVATAVLLGLGTRPKVAQAAVALGVAAVYLMVIVRMALPAEERTHLIEYGVVALFVYEALLERTSSGRRVPHPAVLAAGVASLVGVLDECLQVFWPGRVFDVRDIGFNALAAVLAVSSRVALHAARRLGPPR